MGLLKELYPLRPRTKYGTGFGGSPRNGAMGRTPRSPASAGMSHYADDINVPLGGVGADQSRLAGMLKEFGSPEHEQNRRGGEEADHLVRGQLADALQENGREEEAALLRSGRPVFLHNSEVRPIPRHIDVQGRRWFQRTYGNTYHTAHVFVDGKHVLTVPNQYGYGDQYLHNAVEALENAGLVPPRERYPNGGQEAIWQWRDRHGMDLNNSVEDVRRQRDLNAPPGTSSYRPPEEQPPTQASRYEHAEITDVYRDFPDAVATDPRHIRPINPVIPGKAQAIAENMKKNGWDGLPLLAVGNQALTGSHRLAGSEIAGILAPIIFLDSGEFLDAAKRVRALKPEVNPHKAVFGDIDLPDDDARLRVVEAMKHPEAINLLKHEIDHNDKFGGSEGWEKAEWAHGGTPYQNALPQLK